MRDAATTALEVAGMISLAIALGMVTFAWVGFVAGGVCLIGVGIAEAR